MRYPAALLPFALASLGALSACDLASPERAFNDEARPPQATPFTTLDTSLHYAGRVPFRVTPDLAEFSIEHAALYVDGQRVSSCSGSTCELELPTEAFSEGTHVVEVAVGGRGSELGLLNLLYPPVGARVSRAELVFDQRAPSPVVIEAVEHWAEEVRVRWASRPGTNRNARRYYVQRTVLEGQYPWSGSAGGGTVDAGEPTTLLDATVPPVIGLLLRYDVSTYNGREEADGSPVVATADTVTTPMGPLYAERLCAELDPPSIARGVDEDAFVALCDGTLRRVELRRGVVRTASAPRLLGGSNFPTRAVVASPGGRAWFYVEVEGNTLAAAPLDPATLAVGVATTFALPTTLPAGATYWGSLVATDAGRLLALSWADGRVVSADPSTGTVADVVTFPLPSAPPPGFPARLHLTLDNRRLIRTYAGQATSADLASSPAAVTANRTVAAGQTSFGLDRDGRLYVGAVGAPRVAAYDPATLAEVASWPVPASGLNGLWVGASHVFASVPGVSGAAVGASLYRLEPGGARTGPWEAARLPGFVLPSRDGRSGAALIGTALAPATFN